MSDWLKEGQAAASGLYAIGRDLRDRSGALRTIGQDLFGTHLLSLATRVEAEADIITQSFGQAVSEQIKTAGDHSTAILEAALAGAELAQQEGES